jgi:hypothetical protein
MEANSNEFAGLSTEKLTRRRNNLAALIEGWGGQIPDAECNCEDCVYLRPLIAELGRLDNELRYN